MPIIIVIDKSGSAKQQKILDTNLDHLYKKAGFKSNDGFECRNEWKIDFDGKTKYNIHVYGKIDGKAGQENKFDFPPPIDNTLFFGSVVLVNIDNNHIKDLTIEMWNQIYDYLFGGFEDINNEEDDEDEMDTDDEIDMLEQSISAKKGHHVEIKRTKQGYAKDGFIVDDDDEDEATEYTETEDDVDDEDTNDDSEKESVKIAPTTTRKSKRLAKKPKKEVYVEEHDEFGYLDCTSELEEEDYV